MAQARMLSEECAIDYTPSSAVALGEVIVQGDLVGVATRPIAANQLGSLQVSGVVELDKIAATAITAGAYIYWDDANNWATPTAGALKKIGKAVKAALAADTKVIVLMTQQG